MLIGRVNFLTKRKVLWLSAAIALASIAVFLVVQSTARRGPQGLQASDLPQDWQRLFREFSDSLAGEETGAMASLTKRVVDAEQNQQPIPTFQDLEFQAIFGQALKLRGQLEYAWLNTSLDRDTKVALTAKYIKSVLLPMNTLVNLLWTLDMKSSGVADPMDQLLFRVPSALVPEKSINEMLLQHVSWDDSVNTIKQVREAFAQGKRSEAMKKFGLAPTGIAFEEKGEYIRRAKFSYSDAVTLQPDVVIAGRAPTRRVYARALKAMMTSVMIGQIGNLRSMIPGRAPPLPVPEMCRSGLLAGLPEEISMLSEDEQSREYRIQSMLGSQGLSYDGSNQKKYEDEYLSFQSSDPLLGPFTGMLPFERIELATRALDPATPKSGLLEPMIDDASGFAAVVALAKQRALSKIPSRFSKLDEFVASILTLKAKKEEDGAGPAQTAQDVEKTVLPLDLTGLPNYLADLYVQRKDPDIESLVCPAAAAVLGRTVTLGFPRLYGNEGELRWALGKLSQVAERLDALANRDPVEFGKRFAPLGKICPKDFCKNKNDLNGLKRYMQTLVAELGAYDDPFDYAPRVFLDRSRVYGLYPALAKLWDVAVQSSWIPEARMTEKEYLSFPRMQQNPWAGVRMAYVIASECEFPQYRGLSPHPFWYFGEVLKIDRPITSGHGNVVLSASEKQKYWSEFRLEEFTKTGFVFGVKDAKGEELFSKIDQIFRLPPLLTRERIRAAAATVLPHFQRGPFMEEIDKEVLSGKQAQLALGLFEIYNSQGRLEVQEALFEALVNELKLDGQAVSDISSKIEFLRLDGEVKRRIYFRLMGNASTTHELELRQRFRDLCALDSERNDDDFRKLVSISMRIQEDLGQLIGLDEMPSELRSLVESYSRFDRENLILGFSQIPLFLFAGVLAAGCTFGTAGACFPIAAAAMGVVVTGVNIKMASNSLNWMMEANDNEVFARQFEDLGYTREEAISASRRGAHWAWATMDFVFILPLVGQVGQAVETGVRTGAKFRSTMRYAAETGARGFSQVPHPFSKIGRAAVQQADLDTRVNASLYYLGYRSASKDELFTRIGLSRLESQSARDAFSSGRIVPQVTTETIERLPTQFAKVLAPVWGNDPKVFRRFLESYRGDRLETFTRRLESYKKTYGSEGRLNFLRRLWLKTPVPAWRINRLTMFVEQQKRVESVLQELNQLGSTGGSLEAHLSKHFTFYKEFFQALPVRKREIPFYALVQGSPLSTGMFGMQPFELGLIRSYISVPGLRATGEALVAKRIAVSAETLAYEGYRRQALAQIGMQPGDLAHDTYHLMKRFSAAVNSSGNSQALQSFEKFQGEVTQRVVSYFRAHHPTTRVPDFAALKQMLFPKTGADEALSRLMAEGFWNRVPSEELFGIQDLVGAADEVAKAMSTYKNADQFDDFLSALKVLTMPKTPTVPMN